LPLDLEMLLPLAGEDAVEELLRVVRVQRLIALQALKLAAHPNHGWRFGGHVQVGRVARDHLLEQIVDGIGEGHMPRTSYRQPLYAPLPASEAVYRTVARSPAITRSRVTHRGGFRRLVGGDFRSSPLGRSPLHDQQGAAAIGR